LLLLLLRPIGSSAIGMPTVSPPLPAPANDCVSQKLRDFSAETFGRGANALAAPLLHCTKILQDCSICVQPLP
jgi:hypothetical protein